MQLPPNHGMLTETRCIWKCFGPIIPRDGSSDPLGSTQAGGWSREGSIWHWHEHGSNRPRLFPSLDPWQGQAWVLKGEDFCIEPLFSVRGSVWCVLLCVRR